MKHIREAMGTSFLIGMLGFFESSVAAKSLGGDEVISGMAISPNRELIALGTANLVGSCFMAIPAFGGYGRSKVNKSTGGKSPMSSILLAIITVICILFLLPYFYYLPVSSLGSLVAFHIPMQPTNMNTETSSLGSHHGGSLVAHRRSAS